MKTKIRYLIIEGKLKDVSVGGWDSLAIGAARNEKELKKMLDDGFDVEKQRGRWPGSDVMTVIDLETGKTHLA